jgi:hypothetical protein
MCNFTSEGGSDIGMALAAKPELWSAAARFYGPIETTYRLLLGASAQDLRAYEQEVCQMQEVPFSRNPVDLARRMTEYMDIQACFQHLPVLQSSGMARLMGGVALCERDVCTHK